MALGGRVLRERSLGGGCVGDVRLVELEDGRRVVCKLGSPGGGLDIEGAMLGDLGGRLPVPGVLLASDDLLIMEHVEHDGVLGAGGERHAAELLAALHANEHDRYGYASDTLIGGLRQVNPWEESWAAFFGEHRLVFMAREAHGAGRLSERTLGRVEGLARGPLAEIVGEAGPPSLIHGDVWGGNVLAHGGRIAAFIDPAIYFGDAEIELAFITLFGTFGEAFFERYHELRPIRPGFFETRRDLYNLYPLLVHTRLFGGGYAQSVERTLERFGV